MFSFKRPGSSQEPAPDKPEEAARPARKGLFSRLRDGLSKTRHGLADGITGLLRGRPRLDEDFLEELETQLLISDVGVEATGTIMRDLGDRIRRHKLDEPDALLSALQEDLRTVLAPCVAPIDIPRRDTPFVILMVGINGAGKTTTIGKLASRFQAEGRTVMLAAGDTFRAAAVEQLEVWGQRNDIPVISQQPGADPASVVFDALQSAQARGIDILIADTAGRLHTQANLMDELSKIKRVMGKLDADAPHEVMLVIDAGTGQNALSQARQFHDAVGLTGITLTKLDGTAKGGIIFAIASQLGIPIRFIGVGEGIEDLRPFDAGEFVQALFDSSGDA